MPCGGKKQAMCSGLLDGSPRGRGVSAGGGSRRVHASKMERGHVLCSCVPGRRWSGRRRGESEERRCLRRAKEVGADGSSIPEADDWCHRSRGTRNRRGGVSCVLSGPSYQKGNPLALVSSGLATGGPNRREEEGEGAGRGAKKSGRAAQRAAVPQRGTRSIYSRRHRHAGAPDEKRCRAGEQGRARPAGARQRGKAGARRSARSGLTPTGTRLQEEERPGLAGVCCRCVQTPSQVAPGWCGPESPGSMVRLDEVTGSGSWGLRGGTKAVRGRTTWGSWWKCRLLAG
jgi:hypothetical protein